MGWDQGWKRRPDPESTEVSTPSSLPDPEAPRSGTMALFPPVGPSSWPRQPWRAGEDHWALHGVLRCPAATGGNVWTFSRMGRSRIQRLLAFFRGKGVWAPGLLQPQVGPGAPEPTLKEPDGVCGPQTPNGGAPQPVPVSPEESSVHSSAHPFTRSCLCTCVFRQETRPLKLRN